MWAIAHAEDVEEAMETSLAGELQRRSTPWT